MKLATVGQADLSSGTDIAALYQKLIDRLGGKPDLAVAYFTADLGADVFTAVSELRGDTPVIGTSSCQGVMTDEGLFGHDGNGLAMMGVADAEGDFGTAFVVFEDDPSAAATEALMAAMGQAGRPGELPDLILTHSSPGSEEIVIDAIDKLTGGHAPIVGGSAADNDITGGWSMFANDNSGATGVALAVLYSSEKISTAFQSGYEPTEKTGKVTASEGRTLLEIDGRPAAVVYNEWTDGAIDDAFGNSDNNVLGDTTMRPLGRQAGVIELHGTSVPYYTLIHPERVTDDKGLTLFADVEEGQTLIMMQGTTSSLVRRAGDVAMTAGAGSNPVHGGFVVYCAGCRLAVDGELSDVVDRLNDTLSGQPFIGCFTFGEQGCLLGGENQHGNLMISIGLFEQMP